MAASLKMSIVENSTSVANNTSSVTVKITASWTYGSYHKPATTLNVTINGTKYTKSVLLNPNRTTSGSNTVFTKTVTIAHNSDGKKTMSASASWYVNIAQGDYLKASASKTLSTIPRTSKPTCPSSGKLGTAMIIATNRKSSSFKHTITAAYSGSSVTIATKTSSASVSWTPPISWCTKGTSAKCTITCTTYSGSTKVGSATCTTTLSRPATSTLTVSATSCAIDGSSRVTLTTAGNYASYTHSLVYAFAGTTYTAGIASTAVKGSTTFTPPTSLKSKIPNATSGVATVYLYTYYSGTLLATSSKTVTLTVPAAIKPTVSNVSVVDTTGNAAKYGQMVAGKSIPKVTITASGADGSTLKTYGAVINGAAVTSTSNTITSSKAITSSAVGGYVIDSRSRQSTTFNTNVAMLAYSAPAIYSFTATRVKQINGAYVSDDTGETIKLICSIAVSPLGNKNSKSIRLSWTKNATGETGEETISFNAYSGQTDPIYIPGFVNTSSYNLTLRLTDDFTSVTRTVSIQSAEVILDFHKDGKHMSVGKISEGNGENGFDCAWEANFDKNVHAPQIYLDGHTQPVGYFWTGDITSRTVPSDGVWHQWGYVSLLPGTWLLHAYASYDPGVGGYHRSLAWWNHDTDTLIPGAWVTQQGMTHTNNKLQCIAIVKNATITRYDAYHKQNSGAALPVRVRLQVLRIG